VYRLFKEHPDYFQLNEATAYTSGVNGSKLLDETISAAYLRGDVKLLGNRLRLTAGARYERTDDDGRGPLNDPNAIYQRAANGTLLRGANGRPVPVAGTALQLAQLQYRERGARSKSNYDGYYPSLNGTYTVTPDLLVRAAYARTIGRPDITDILPGVTITDLGTNSADPVIRETNTGLKPWHADNWDLSLESYNVQGAVASVSLFQKDVTNFFTSVQRPASAADLERYGLGPEYADYDLVTTENSSERATIKGVEINWRQSLRPFAFVPEWAKGLSVYANVTRLNISGPGADNFLPFRPRLLNWGVSYTNRKALVRVNVAQQGAQRTALLATNATTPAGSYQYIALRIITDLSFEYRFHKRIALYGSARNLFQNPRRQFRAGPNTPDYARVVRYDYYGALLTVGVKGTF
jgi:TonB-dependent receptor